MFKPFYIHYNKGPGKVDHSHARGFTAKIAPVENDYRRCTIQVSYCSPKDQFCKKEGRIAAENKAALVINKRAVPSMLSAYETRVNQYPWEGTSSTWWDYVLKYMV